jgi:hypothetical protein
MVRTAGKAALLLLSLGFVACGHPATQTDCTTILDRIVELELKAQNVTDPAEVTKRRESALASGDKAQLYQGCVGKRITDAALACVRTAKSVDEITDRCLQ